MTLTVEEAAQKWVIDHDIDGSGIGTRAFHAFEDGAAWQKEQGIEWISVEEQLPDSIYQHSLGWNSSKVLVTNGISLDYTHYCFNKEGVPVNWFAIVLKPTHWANIKLPKTDK